MPGTSGFDLIETIRQTKGATQPAVMMLSAANLSEHAARCKELGIAFLLKPVSSFEVMETAAQLLRKLDRDQKRTNRPPIKPTHVPVPPKAEAPARILIAEDNLINQKVITSMLRSQNYELQVVGDGARALAAWRDREYNLILMDMQMPVMDGLEATKRIRQAEKSEKAGRRRTPVLAVTANARKEDREACINAGMDGFISKPIENVELLEKIKSLIKEDRASTQVPALRA